MHCVLSRPARYGIAWVAVAWMGLVIGASVAAAAPRGVIVGDAHRSAGEIEPSEVLSYEFTLRNDGDETLAIQDLKPTCYCTSAKTTLWDVPAGGTAKIQVRIDPSDFVGRIKKGVEIVTNDPQNPVLLVDVDIVVRPGIAVIPPELDFGRVAETGSNSPLQFQVKVPRARKLEITGVSSEAAFLKAEHEPLELDERFGATVFVDVLPGAPPGAFRSHVLVHTTDTARPTIKVPVLGRGPGGLRAAPERVVFAVAAAGSEVGAFEVSGGTVHEVSSSDPRVMPKLESLGDGRFRVVLHLSPDASKGRVMARVSVASKAGEDPDLTVPVLGMVR